MKKGGVIITGSAHRIGREIAKTLAMDGYPVAIHYNTSKVDAYKFADEIKSSGGKAIPVYADLGAKVEIHEMFGNVVREFGQIESIVNNASLYVHDRFDSFTKENFDRHMNINVRYNFEANVCTNLCCKITVAMVGL